MLKWTEAVIVNNWKTPSRPLRSTSAADAKMSCVDVRDVAAVAAAAQQIVNRRRTLRRLLELL